MNLSVDGSIDQERISLSEWIMPSPCMPPERKRTGSSGWLNVCVWHSASLVRWFLKLLIGQSRSLPFSQFWSPSSNWQRSQRIKDKPRSSWSPVTVEKLYPSRNKGMYTGFIRATSFAWCWLGEEMENYVVIRARQQNLTLYHWEQSNNQSWRRHLLTTLPQIKIFLNTHPTPANFEQPPTLKHTHLLT